MKYPKIAFIFNPVAGKGEAGRYYTTFLSLLPPQVVCRGFETTGRQTDLVRSLVQQGYFALIIAGGDGTVHEIVNEIMRCKGDLVIGILPVGTGNDFARSLIDYRAFAAHPQSYLTELARALTRKTVGKRKVEVFSVNDKVFFSSYLGIGFDGRVISSFQQYRSFPLPNKLLYLFSIVKTLLKRRRFRVELLGEDKKPWDSGLQDLFQVLLLKSSSYAGGVFQADMQGSGTGFRLVCMKTEREFLHFFLKNCSFESLRKRATGKDPMVLNTDSISLEITGEVPVQIDGENYSEKFSKGGVLTVRKAGEIRLIL
ncbi:MAG: diacylglycerol/lipid kinase family protein [Nitrospinota bacterium]